MPVNKKFFELAVGDKFHFNGDIYEKIELIDNGAFIYNAKTQMDQYGNICFQLVLSNKMVRMVE